MEVAALPRTRQVRARLAELRAELRQLSPPRPWWGWWRAGTSSSSSSNSAGSSCTPGAPAVAAAGGR